MSCRIAIGPEIFRLGKKPISIFVRQTKKRKGTDGERRKEIEKDQVKEYEIFRLGKKLIPRKLLFYCLKETDKGTYNNRGKKTEKEKDHVKEHEIFRRGGQSENKVTKSSVSHPIPLQFFSNLESREVFQSCRKLAED